MLETYEFKFFILKTDQLEDLLLSLKTTRGSLSVQKPQLIQYKFII